jgi:hypothetical protein
MSIAATARAISPAGIPEATRNSRRDRDRDTFLVTKTGKPYSAGDFSDQFRKWCDEAGLPKRCTIHGLRKFGCVLFRRAQLRRTRDCLVVGAHEPPRSPNALRKALSADDQTKRH